jgi:flagellar basal-body rod modification protein FlgD
MWSNFWRAANPVAETIRMVTTPIVQGQTGTQLPASNTSSNPYNLSPQDFIQLMVTQLENQDPTQPTSSQDLLTQVSQIGQLESSTELQTTMQSVTLQTQVGSASALIGKSVVGIDSNNNSSTGVVNSVSVAGGAVTLNLDTGDSIAITNLSSIAPATTTTTTN